jgi:hypothetical protein
MKKLLRILGTVLGLLLVVGYFAFSTYFFSPFEGGLDADVAGLVPRKVQFFAAKAHLDRDFDPFPRLAAADEFALDETWSSILQSPEYTGLMEAIGLEAALAEVEAAAGDLPLGLGPLDVFGGEELAIAGELKGADLSEADWAAYGSINWAGKLAIETLRYPSLSNLEAQGIQAEDKGRYLTLSGGALTRPIHVGRIRDVGIFGTGEELVASAFELENRQYQDSILLRDEYRAFVQTERRSPDGDDIELFCNLRGVCEEMGIDAAWPDQKADTFFPKFTSRYFQLNSLNQVSGFLDVDRGVRLDLHASLSSELISPLMKKHYSLDGIGHENLLQNAARMAPADSAVFLYLNGDMGDLLDEALSAAEPAMKQAIEDQFRSTGRYRQISEIVRQLDSALKDRCVLIMRTNDYPPDPEGPPHNDETVFATALVFWLQGRSGSDTMVQIRELIGQQGHLFGLKGKQDSDGTYQLGYYKNKIEGYEVFEFWNELIPGTGVVATTYTSTGMCIISNSFDMTGHLLKTLNRGEAEYPRLSDRPDFRSLMMDSIPTADLVAWVNPKELAETLEVRVPQAARDAVQIDWKTERSRAQAKVLREEFGGKQPLQLSAKEKGRYEQRVNEVLDDVEAEAQRVQGGASLARMTRQVAWLKGAKAFMLMASFAPREVELSLRLIAPLVSGRE